VSSNAESESISAVSAIFGANEWLVDELYEQFLADKNAVDPAWWEFFESYTPGETSPDTSSLSSPDAAATSKPAAPSEQAKTASTAAASAPESAAPAPAEKASAAAAAPRSHGEQAARQA